MARIQGILFDLDGTLVDTEPAASRAVSDCLREWKIDVAPADAAYVTGRTWASAFDFLFEKYPPPLSREEASRAVIEHYRARLESDLIVVPGAATAVRALAARYPLALVSGSYRSEILWALKRLDVLDLFEVILGAEDYPQSKPAPDGYRQALESLNVLPYEAVIFEDSHAGVTAARAAGSWVVAITATNHFAQDTSHAHAFIPDLTLIDVDWIERVSAEWPERPL